MTFREELSAILDRIAKVEKTEDDIETLRQLLRAVNNQNVVNSLTG
ncbi:hypothetical protein [Tychonema sp. BBK16]